MKIRIADDSLRFRLGRADVEALRMQDELQHRLPTGPGAALVFSLRLSERTTEWSIAARDNAVEVLVPKEPLRSWLTSDDLELERQLEKPHLLLMIEKDRHDSP